MEVLFVLIALSMIVAGFFLFTFIMNVKKGQYDDMYTPSIRILFDQKKDNQNSNNGNANH